MYRYRNVNRSCVPRECCHQYQSVSSIICYTLFLWALLVRHLMATYQITYIIEQFGQRLSGQCRGQCLYRGHTEVQSMTVHTALPTCVCTWWPAWHVGMCTGSGTACMVNDCHVRHVRSMTVGMANVCQAGPGLR